MTPHTAQRGLGNGFFFALNLSYSDRKKNGLDKGWEIGHPKVTLMALYVWRMYIKAVILFLTLTPPVLQKTVHS